MKSKNPVGKFKEENILLEKTTISCEKLKHITDSQILKNILSKKDIKNLINIYEKQNKIPVGIDGIVSSFKEGDIICSYRATLFSKNLARQIFDKIKFFLPTIEGYEAIGVNESFRFIDYVKEGILVPHYDGGYTNEVGDFSLLTIVIYLLQGEGGYTEFVKEYRYNDYTDWNKMARKEEITEIAKTQEGDCLIFPHKTLHQGAKTKNRKIIIRSDIMYRVKK